MDKSAKVYARRVRRVRHRVRLAGHGRPRLSVFRSARHIYAQIIDDDRGLTLVSASTLDKTLREALKSGASKDAAVAVGKQVAARAVEKGITNVVFDRGAYRFHGRIKALADAAREAGLKF